MPYNRRSTSKIVRIVGCHTNTVGMYETWECCHPSHELPTATVSAPRITFAKCAWHAPP
jgi:hypothetical protein